MSSIRCECGHLIRDNSTHLPYKASFLPDEDYWEFAYEGTPFPGNRDMFECEACGRILIRARPDENHYLSYLPESTRRGILRHEGANEEE